MPDYPIVTKFASAPAFHYPLAIYSVLVPIVGSRAVKHSVSSPTRYYLSAIAIVAVPSVDYPFVVPPFLFQGLYSPLAIVDCLHLMFHYLSEQQYLSLLLFQQPPQPLPVLNCSVH